MVVDGAGRGLLDQHDQHAQSARAVSLGQPGRRVRVEQEKLSTSYVNRRSLKEIHVEPKVTERDGVSNLLKNY